MRVFVTDRQRGKTTKALEEAFKVSKEPTAFITFSSATAKILREQFARKLNASKLEIFSVQELRFVTEMRRYRHVYFDDADQILYSLVHESLEETGAIRLVTMTGLPVADLGLIKKSAAALWREAAHMVNRLDCPNGEELNELVKQFEARALSLEEAQGGAHEIRNRSDAGTEPRPIQSSDPGLHQG